MTAPHDDDDPDGFAARLRAQPPTAPPAHWREEILAAAMSQATSGRSAWWRAAARALAAWLWPHPYAYAGLAAGWLLVLTLRWSTPASSLPPVAVSPWTQPADRLDDPVVLSRDLLALNAAPPDPTQPAEGRP